MTYTPACWFPCLVHILETEPNEEIKNLCLQTRNDQTDGVLKSNHGGGWQSESHDARLAREVWNTQWETTETGTLRSPHMTNYGSETIVKNFLHGLFAQSLGKVVHGHLELFNYWVNINGKGAYNVKHDHPQAHFSGVYYVQCPENSGEIIFDNPYGFTAFDELSCYKDDFVQSTMEHKAISVTPTAGLLLIFPAHLEHSVAVNNSDEERISIGFNILVHALSEDQFYK